MTQDLEKSGYQKSKWKKFDRQSTSLSKNCPPLNIILKFKWDDNEGDEDKIYTAIIKDIDDVNHQVTFTYFLEGTGAIGGANFYWDYISDNEKMAYL